MGAADLIGYTHSPVRRPSLLPDGPVAGNAALPTKAGCGDAAGAIAVPVLLLAAGLHGEHSLRLLLASGRMHGRGVSSGGVPAT
jgi:hypothetical protein